MRALRRRGSAHLGINLVPKGFLAVLPVVGPITPYRRLCGSAFLVVAAVLAPNVHFAVSLLLSPDAARISTWALFGLYLLLILLPAVRRVSHATSLIALIVACSLVALAMGFTKQMQAYVPRGKRTAGRGRLHPKQLRAHDRRVTVAQTLPAVRTRASRMIE